MLAVQSPRGRGVNRYQLEYVQNFPSKTIWREWKMRVAKYLCLCGHPHMAHVDFIPGGGRCLRWPCRCQFFTNHEGEHDGKVRERDSG